MTDSLSAERYLVRAMLAGEQPVFAAFFDSYFPRVHRFALPRLGRNELKQLREGNGKLKRPVADLSLDMKNRTEKSV